MHSKAFCLSLCPPPHIILVIDSSCLLLLHTCAKGIKYWQIDKDFKISMNWRRSLKKDPLLSVVYLILIFLSLTLCSSYHYLIWDIVSPSSYQFRENWTWVLSPKKLHNSKLFSQKIRGFLWVKPGLFGSWKQFGFATKHTVDRWKDSEKIALPFFIVVWQWNFFGADIWSPDHSLGLLPTTQFAAGGHFLTALF